ncbi:MAG: hypothetical protein ACLTMP_09925 [Eggerthella lenta]
MPDGMGQQFAIRGEYILAANLAHNSRRREAAAEANKATKAKVQKMPISQDRVYRMFSARSRQRQRRSIGRYSTRTTTLGIRDHASSPTNCATASRADIARRVTADLTDMIMQYDHEGMVFARNRAGNLHRIRFTASSCRRFGRYRARTVRSH